MHPEAGIRGGVGPSEGGEMGNVEEETGRGKGAAIVGTAVLVVALATSIAWLRRRHRHDLP
jgi:hypothetical protein